MSDISKIPTSLGETLKEGELQNITIDLTEAVTDSFLDDGLLKDIPVLNILNGIFKTSKNVHDYLLTKKIIHFLIELKEIPKDKRLNQIIKIEDSPKYRTKVGEKILLILDKCDDIEKAEMIGKLFKAYLEEKIDYDDFLRAVSCIDRAYLEDMRFFIKSDWEELFVDDGGSQYLSYGLMELWPIDPQIKAEKNRYSFSEQIEFTIDNVDMKCHLSSAGKTVRKVFKE